MFSSFFHPERSYKHAGREYEKYFNRGQSQLSPYNQFGQSQFPILQGAENELLNPQGLLDKWMQGYQMSPYAKQSFENAKGAGMDAASAQGLLGSNAATQNIQNSSNYIMNADRQEYLRDLMDKYKLGIGLGKDIFGTGANAAGAMSRNDMEAAQNKAGFKYGEETAPGNLLGDLIKQFYLPVREWVILLNGHQRLLI
jgi:hypothetical protein